MLKRTCKHLIYLVLLLLQGCIGGPNYAPIYERTERVFSSPSFHLVRPGDTLYSIAWRYNKEVRKLASANKINSSYLIYPGQKIALKNTVTPPSKSIKPQINSSKKVAGKSKLQPTSSNKSKLAAPIKRKVVPPPQLAQSIRWRWPARGPLGRRFSAIGGVHKGIDIKGKLGEPIYAAGGGEVVYAGSGLVGYGKLLIIKHDEHYLSAYGHNRTLLVEEGVMVKEGQRIADIGNTGTDEVKLHFEIRHNGKPVDPLKLLPKTR